VNFSILLAESADGTDADAVKQLADRLKNFARDVELTRRSAAKKGALLPSTKKPASVVDVGLLLVDR
jgi:hypothetical protein